MVEDEMDLPDVWQMMLSEEEEKKSQLDRLGEQRDDE